MKNCVKTIASLCCGWLMWMGCVERQPLVVASLTVEKLTDYYTPDTCFNKGVSAAYVGAIGERLLLAGGCNFPHLSAAEGGPKVYYDYIWTALPSRDKTLHWTLAGRLPEPAAYGVSLPYEGGLIGIGGTTTDGKSLRRVFRLQLVEGQVQVDSLPSLPVAIDNACGAIADGKIYVVGGNADGKPSNGLYTMDLAYEDPRWTRESQLPGSARVQPVCALAGEYLYVWGGYTPKTATAPASMPTNGCKYHLKTGHWSEVEAPKNLEGEVIALAGGAAVMRPDKGCVFCIGGVNQHLFPRALNGELAGPDYLRHPASWYQFNRYFLAFQVATETWHIVGEREEGARAGASLVRMGDWNYIVCGELKPGIRTPMITRFQ